MLTVDLVKVRRKAGRLQPLWLQGRACEQWMPLAAELIELFQRAKGMTVAELEASIAACVRDASDPVRAAGLVKLLRDRCELEEADPALAEQARRLVFERAAQERRSLGMKEVLDRATLMSSCAHAAGSTAAELEARLFSDLPGAQRVIGFKPIGAAALLQHYNLALAQGVLLRASQVRIELAPCPAVRLRELFRALKFRRLMHQVSGSASEGYRLVIDGPMSLFESTQRYGLQLAMLLPTLVAGEGWELRADVIWGRDRSPLRFELSWRDGLATDHAAVDEPEELELLERTFSKIGSGWVVRRQATVFDIRGKGVFVPDLVFEQVATGRVVYLEVFGTWSRAAVFQRLELLDSSFPGQVILAVSRKLRVSEQAADETFPGRILVYSQSIRAHAVRQLLEQL